MPELTELQKRAYDLREAGKSQKEIAREIGSSRQAVRRLLRRAAPKVLPTKGRSDGKE